MKRVLLSALALLCLLTFTYSNNPTFDTDPNYVLVWSDEFDTDGSPDPSKWYHQTLFPVGTSWFNGELQHYTNELANSFVESGVLKIVAKKESYTDQGVTKDYTSARLNSKFAFTYGRVEIRAKLPSGAGTWPAFWTLGKNIDENGGYWDATYGTTAWPACGEIDIMEHWGSNQNFVQSAMHTPSSSGGTINKGGQTIATVSDQFHVYGLEWTEDKMVFDVDGVVHYTYEPTVKDASTWPFDVDQYLLLNTAIEGNMPSVNPGFTEATMEIDYVRVYEAVPTMSGTEVVNLAFDDANATTGWSEVADATSADASISWGDGLGETGGALQVTASNSTTDGKAYIFQYDASSLNYDGATDVQLTFDLKTVGALNGAAVHLQTNIPGPGVENNFDLQTQGLNDVTWTSYSFDFSSVDAAASTFSMHFNLASGAFVGAGGTLLIDNVKLTTTGGGGGGGGATEPTTSAPTPTQDPADVISIFSDAYTDLAGTDFNPNWGQSTVVTTEMIDGGDVLKYANTNYQGTALAGNNDLTGMDFLHIDMWTPDADVVQVTPINASGSPVEVLVDLTPINIGGWNSYDIPLTDFTSGGMSIDEVFQMKFDVQAGTTGTTLFLDNIYFYSSAPAPTAPTTSAPTPTQDPADVISIFSDAYTDLAGTDFNPNWGQSTVVTTEMIDGGDVLKYANTNYQGTALAGNNDLTGMDFLHIDMWTPDADVVQVTPINASGSPVEVLVDLTPINIGGWNSYDIPLTDFTSGGMSIDEVFQMKFDVQAGTTGTTLFLDNIYFYSSAPAPTAPTTSAPTPTQDPADVISIFSDAYTDLAGTDFNPNWGQSTVVTTEMIDGGDVLKYANTNYQGTALAGNNDLTGMDFLHIDMWTPDADVVQVTPINASGSPVEVLVDLTPINIGGWNSYDIPLTDFTSGGMSIDEVFQMKFDVQAGTTGTTLFLDNIYFYSSAPAPTAPTTSAPTPTQDPADVISIFSDAYTDLAGTDFNPNWGQSTVVTTEMIDGGDVLKYANTNYQGTALAGNNDLTGMDFLHIDMWTPDADVVQVTPINASGSPVEVLVDLTPINIGGWNSYDIPLTDFTSGGMSIDEVFQMKFDVQAGTTGTTLFLDNIYFYSSGPAPTAPTTSAPTPTQDPADVISIFSDAYTDLAGTDFNPNWGQSTVVTTEMIDGGDVLKYANTNYQGTALAGNNDLTGMDFLHIDMWTPDADVVQVTPINASGSPVEVLVDLTPINIGGWNSYDIPLTDFTSGGMSIDEVFQMKFDVQAGTTGTTLFLDNIYFYADNSGGITAPTTSAPTPTQDAADVVSIFSDAYTDLAGTDFNPNWGQSTVVTTEMIDGGNVLKYANTNYQGTQLAGNNDLTAMEYLHIDMWTPDADVVQVSPINASGSPVEVLVSLTPINIGSWNSYDIPLTDFTSGGMSINEVMQMKFDVQAGTTGTTLFLDNIYFWKAAATSGSDATLSDLLVDGVTIDGFNTNILTYAVELPFGSTVVPTVTATTTDATANAVVTAAGSLPGTTSVVVTAQDGTTTQTYNVNFTVAPEFNGPQTAAPTPTRAAGDVISVYSDAYTGIAVSNFNPDWGQATIVTDEMVDGDNIMKYANLNYQGIEFAGTNDVSNMEYLHLDVWTTDADVVQVTPINPASTPAEFLVDIGIDPNDYGTWVGYDIPLTDFVGVDLSAVLQMKFDAQAGTTGTTIFLDNIYYWKTPAASGSDASLSDLLVDGVTIDGFNTNVLDYEVELPFGSTVVPTVTATTTDVAANAVINPTGSLPGTTAVVVTAQDGTTTQTYNVEFTIAPEFSGPQAAAPTPTRAEVDVISIYSDAYTGVAVSNFNPNWGQATVVTDEMVDGDNIMKYENLNYQGIELTSSIDVSQMEYLHVDVWTNDADVVQLTPINPGSTPPELLVDLGIDPNDYGSWVGYDIPLTDYVGVDLTGVLQMKFDAQAGTIGSTIFIDNLYFWKTPVAAGEDATLSDLLVDGVTVDGFNTNVLNYEVELPFGTSVVPTVTATTTDASAGAVVNDASSLPGSTTVVVTAADGTTMKTYTIEFTVAPEFSEPQEAAPIPTQAAVDVISIYSDSYTNIGIGNYNPNWGQSTTVTDEVIDGNNFMKYANLNYQGIELAESNDLSAMEYLHVDVWTANADIVKITPINPSSTPVEFLVDLGIDPSDYGTWVGYDIAVTRFEGVDLTGVLQMKFDAQAGELGNTIFVDNIYFWKEPESTESNSTLTELLVDGVSVNRFSPSTFEYYVEFPEGTTAIPTVSATPLDPGAVVSITDPTELPGMASVLVTSKDGTTTSTYNIEYAIDQNLSKDASLSDLQVDGVSIAGFNTDTYEYSMELAETVTDVPVVTATANDANASVVVEAAIGLPGVTKVIVTAEDGSTVRNYSIDFTYPAGTEVTYTIAGTITAGGNPFSDGTVVMYDIDDIDNSATSDLASDGTYSISSMAEGSYYIYVTSNSDDFVTTFYGNVSSATDPEAVPAIIVMDRNRTVDVTMVAKPDPAVEMTENGATINFQAQSVSDGNSRIVSGRVSQGEALANVLVILNTIDDEYVADGVTDSEGNVTFTGLPTGDYKLVVDVPGVGKVSSEVSAIEGQEAEFTGLIDENGIIINQVLGLDEDLLNDMTVYPNPAVERISIAIPKGLRISDYRISIVSLSGQVSEASSEVRDSEIVVDVSNLDSGVYFIRLTTEKGSANRRFIKQ